MTESKMPTDANYHPIPVLAPANGSAYEIAVTETSAINADDINEDIAGFYTTTDCFIKFGASDVVASESDYDVFLPAGSYREYSAKALFIAAIKATGADDGTVYINGLK